MSIEQYQVKLKEGEKHCKYCHGLGFVFCCRAPDDCEELICEDCGGTGIEKHNEQLQQQREIK